MLNKSRVLSLIVALTFVFVLMGQAQQKTEETVTCPVSGEMMKKAEAKISGEYKGTTYYFCCDGCKVKFMKDPELYLQKKTEAQAACKDVYGCPMCKDVKSEKPGKCSKCGMDMVKAEPGKDIIIKKVVMEGPMHDKGMMMKHQPGGCGMMMGQGLKGLQGPGCPMMSKDVDFKVEYTKDGVVITVTSKNLDTVKIIQGHAAQMKNRCQADCQADCQGQVIKKEVIKKEELKKEPDKK
jgi:YHS domain-containing protein